MKKRIAILCSDLHLSLQAPACRADKDWLEVQARYLGQLGEIAGPRPVVCAGDIFDRWNPTPELIHFALVHLPDKMICIPGQHDLPDHSMENMHRSAYGVLVKAGKIRNLSLDKPWEDDGMIINGCGWGESIPAAPRDSRVRLLALHRFVWINDATKYPGAPEEGNLKNVEGLEAFDAVVIGDNHKGWHKSLPKTEVINCGTFIRRKADEMDYQPAVGALFDDGTIDRIPLDTSGDRFHENARDRESAKPDLARFLESLEGLGEHGLDFKATVKRTLDEQKTDPETRKLILSIINA